MWLHDAFSWRADLGKWCGLQCFPAFCHAFLQVGSCGSVLCRGNCLVGRTSSLTNSSSLLESLWLSASTFSVSYSSEVMANDSISTRFTTLTFPICGIFNNLSSIIFSNPTNNYVWCRVPGILDFISSFDTISKLYATTYFKLRWHCRFVMPVFSFSSFQFDPIVGTLHSFLHLIVMKLNPFIRTNASITWGIYYSLVTWHHAQKKDSMEYKM